MKGKACTILHAEKNMGIWETGLYQNDLSADVRNGYIAKLKAGKSDKEALQEILEEYQEESEDFDEKYDFYLGLADTMWKKGRLTQEIKEKALELLEEDRVSERWENDRIRKDRGKVLDKLKSRLESPMPERKKISVHKPYKLGWSEGEVYCFQITGNDSFVQEYYKEYIGWHALFYIDRIYTKDWQVEGIQDEIADAYFFFQQNKPHTPEDILTATKVRKATGICKVYICESSKRCRPKDLTLLGTMEHFPEEMKENFSGDYFGWNGGEGDIVWGYARRQDFEKEYEKKCESLKRLPRMQ